MCCLLMAPGRGGCTSSPCGRTTAHAVRTAARLHALPLHFRPAPRAQERVRAAARPPWPRSHLGRKTGHPTDLIGRTAGLHRSDSSDRPSPTSLLCRPTSTGLPLGRHPTFAARTSLSLSPYFPAPSSAKPPIIGWEEDVIGMVEQKLGKQKISISFECETLKADDAAQEHIKKYLPHLVGADAVVNIGQMSISGINFDEDSVESGEDIAT
ncbi:hypothetical protein KSP40_PGU001590 [Platanthera guangdongensis]|uniref:Uncharacterized protein n=1 Tax=Platanthera guangdongensis TaxID=2320717 RepID=A0ABR2MZI1_9ASPA